MLSRIGGMFGTTLTGTLAAAFVYELYFGPAGVSSDEIKHILAIQTTITTVAGILVGAVAGVIVAIIDNFVKASDTHRSNVNATKDMFGFF